MWVVTLNQLWQKPNCEWFSLTHSLTYPLSLSLSILSTWKERSSLIRQESGRMQGSNQRHKECVSNVNSLAFLSFDSQILRKRKNISYWFSCLFVFQRLALRVSYLATSHLRSFCLAHFIWLPWQTWMWKRPFETFPGSVVWTVGA